jgi:hypothetical protein
MRNYFIKTDHFWEMAWERKFDQNNIDRLLDDLKPAKRKTRAVFGKQKLNRAGIKLKNKSHLIIVMDRRVLITIFEEPDLYRYMKKQNNQNFLII